MILRPSGRSGAASILFATLVFRRKQRHFCPHRRTCGIGQACCAGQSMMRLRRVYTFCLIRSAHHLSTRKRALSRNSLLVTPSASQLPPRGNKASHEVRCWISPRRGSLSASIAPLGSPRWGCLSAARVHQCVTAGGFLGSTFRARARARARLRGECRAGRNAWIPPALSASERVRPAVQATKQYKTRVLSKPAAGTFEFCANSNTAPNLS